MDLLIARKIAMTSSSFIGKLKRALYCRSLKNSSGFLDFRII